MGRVHQFGASHRRSCQESSPTEPRTHHLRRQTSQKVENAVVTVPAYFNDAQRQATKDDRRAKRCPNHQRANHCSNRLRPRREIRKRRHTFGRRGFRSQSNGAFHQAAFEGEIRGAEHGLV
ncbi:Chaperone protein DnaK [Linum perenne]